MAPTDHIKTPGGPDEIISHLVSAFERALGATSPDSLAQLLGSLERLKAIAWGHLLAVAVPAERPRTEPLDDLRHLTPIQVAELLSLKEAYVHELCRSRKIPATKQGKYWIIPVVELREWLVRARGIDPRRSSSLALPDWPGARAPSGGSHDLQSVTPAGTGRRRRAAIGGIQRQVLSTDSKASRTEGPQSR